jgi:uncharacterized protein
MHVNSVSARRGATLEDVDGSIDLADFRRRVADNYAQARVAGAGPEAWAGWRLRRDEMFATHAESPVPADRRGTFTGMAFFPYDPSWRLLAVVEPVPAPDPPDHASRVDAGARFARIGTAVAEREGLEIRLPLMWLDAYGGGLFLPFRDATNGGDTYGGGRYLLDQVKGADLGTAPDGRLVLDFNYAYHPSCAHDGCWVCPLPTPESRIDAPVQAGELAPPA